MNKRQKLFIGYYTSQADRNTHGNATQSAIKAGYSARTSYAIGYKLLRNAEIKAEIDKIEKQQAQEYEITKEEAIKEARQNYLTASTDNMKKYWNDIYHKLRGWNVERTEVNQNVNMLQQSDEIAEQVRLYGRNNN